MSKETQGIYSTIGHHTCQNTGDQDVLNKAPFFSTRSTNFLGPGFYFWENNLAKAKEWGGSNYIDKSLDYSVFQAEMQIDRNDFFDLIGDDNCIQYYKSIVAIAQAKDKRIKKWTLGKIIAFLRSCNVSTDPDFSEFNGKFNYNIIRALDFMDNDKKNSVKFAEHLPNYTFLNSCRIICVYEVKEGLLANKRIVHSSKKFYEQR